MDADKEDQLEDELDPDADVEDDEVDEDALVDVEDDAAGGDDEEDEEEDAVVDDDEEDEEEDAVVEDDEEDDQASLDEILAQRAAARRASDDPDDDAELLGMTDDPDEPVVEPLPVKVAPVKGEQEFVCNNCFLVKPRVQLADPKRGFCRDCV